MVRTLAARPPRPVPASSSRIAIHMEETTPQSGAEPIRSEDIAKAIAAKRKRMREFSRRQIERLGTIESQMSATLEQIADELARDRRTATSQSNQQQQQSLTAALQERDSLAEQLSRQQTDLRKLQTQLDELRTQYESAQSHSEQQAADTQSQLQGLLEEKKRIQKELENRQLQGSSENADLSALQTRLASVEVERNSLQELLDAANQQVSRQSEMAQQIEHLQSERDALTQLLTEAEHQLSADSGATGDTGTSAEQMEDLQRRYEMAMEDIRELKTKNADLDKRLAAARAAKSSSAGDSIGGGMDWESQKRRMLAQLESEYDEGNEEDKAARLEIESVIDITDAVAAEKDREIQELKQLLDEQSSNLGSVAVGAAAFGEMMDKDEVIRQERERLQLLQAEWEEKLRQAEIDLSVQRAKIARERNELDEKQRQIEQQKTDQVSIEPDGNASSKSKKPQKGRWLSRLGLKENEE